MSALEAEFQKKLKNKIKERFPGAIVIKNDARYLQGIPDLTVLYKDKWATLEVKRSARESHQPNQDTYVSTMNDMSFSSFVYPENMEEVLNAMAQLFERP